MRNKLQSKLLRVGVFLSPLLLTLACSDDPNQIGKRSLNASEAMHMYDAACEQRKDPATLGMVFNPEQNAWYHRSKLVSVKIHSERLCTMAFGSSENSKTLEFMLRGKGAEEFDIDGGTYEDQVLYIVADMD